MQVHDELKRKWEHRFPDLSGEWTHWWIEGDGALLAVVPLEEFATALRVVQDHHQRFGSIFVHRAQIDASGEASRQVARFEVANRRNDS